MGAVKVANRKTGSEALQDAGVGGHGLSKGNGSPTPLSSPSPCLTHCSS